MAVNYDKGQYRKKKRNFYSIVGLIGDILFYPVILIALLCVLIIYVDRQQNKVPSIFGLSIASISSESMLASGFKKGDIVFLTEVNPADLRGGDIIGFYYKPTKIEKRHLTLVQRYDRDTGVATDYVLPEPTVEDEKNRPTLEEVRNDKTKVYFHRIIEIYVDKAGVLYFRTQGDSVGGMDSIFCAEYVVGEYSHTPEWVRGTFSFIASPTGMIVLVVAPLGILILFMLLSIIEQISKMGIEKRVLRRQLRFNAPESVQANIGIEMMELDKIKFFASSDPADREEVADFLWGYLKDGKTKEKEKYSQIAYITQNFEKNPTYYWRYWIQNAKSNNKREKIQKAWQVWDGETRSKQTYFATQKNLQTYESESKSVNSQNEEIIISEKSKKKNKKDN